MRVVVNKPVPVVAPPVTYDLQGVTAYEMKFLRHLVGQQCTRDTETALGLPRESCTNVYGVLAWAGK